LNQFFKWEKNIPSKYKGKWGEIKSSNLPDHYLLNFVNEVLITNHYVGLTPLMVLPADSNTAILDKFKKVYLRGIDYSIKELEKLKRKKQQIFINLFTIGLIS